MSEVDSSKLELYLSVADKSSLSDEEKKKLKDMHLKYLPKKMIEPKPELSKKEKIMEACKLCEKM